jgi:hypothetical protein
VLLLACAVVTAVIVGWASGGRLSHLANVPLHGWRLVAGVVTAGAVAIIAGRSSSDAAALVAIVGVVVSTTLLVVLLVRNVGVEGLPLLAVGLLLNAVVVITNGGMPVSLDAAARAGVATGPLADGSDARHVLAGPATHLDRLGDVIAVPFPSHPEVVSPGDVLVVAGAGLLVFAGMRRRPPAQLPTR